VTNLIDYSDLFRKASSLYIYTSVLYALVCVWAHARLCVGDMRFLDKFSITILSKNAIRWKRYDF
jgi:hypothetical protein